MNVIHGMTKGTFSHAMGMCVLGVLGVCVCVCGCGSVMYVPHETDFQSSPTVA